MSTDHLPTRGATPRNTASQSTTGSGASEGTSLPTAVWQLSEPDEPIVLAGYFATVDVDVALPAGWVLRREARLDAVVVSGEAVRDDAALRFDIGDRPVHTWNPGDEPQISIEIPTEVFDGTATELEISTTTPLDDEDVCIDPDHVARWFDLGHPELSAEIAPSDLDVARAVAGMGPVSALTGEPIVIERNGSGAESLEALGAIVAAVAHHGIPADWVLDADDDVSGARIRIEEADGEPATVSVAVVDDRPVLTFAGDPAGIVRIADAAGDPGRLLFFNRADVDVAAVPDAEVAEPGEVFSFVSEGYDDRTLRGSGSKALIYRIHIPAGAPPNTATLGIAATLSPAMADDGGTISVKINGSDEEIVAVAEEDGSIDALHTVTPADLRPGLNFVTLEAQLGDAGGNGFACDDGIGNWITFSKNSAVGVDRSGGPEEVRLGVEDARFALATELDFDATDVVIPDDYVEGDLLASLDLISELANRAQGGSPRLVEDDDADRDRHLVVTGRAGDRSLLRSLPARPDTVGVVAATASPYAVGRVFMAFTGERNEDVLLAIETAMSSRVNDVTAPFALVTADGLNAIGGEEVVLAERVDDGDVREPGPDEAAYEEWLRSQLVRVEEARAPETDQRRTIALVLGLAVAMIGGVWWLRRARSNDDAAAH